MVKEMEKEKEYNNGKLIFEGEFLDGIKVIGIEYDESGDIIYKYNNLNGRGKEYSFGKLIFEGEYLNGKRNGKGKEYNIYNELIFEGEYLNGNRNGKGKEYNEKVQLIFEGEYKNDKKWNGKIYDSLANIYEVKNGKRLVKYYYHGHLSFEGEYLNGEINGKGKEYIINEDELIFEGKYINGKRNGKGKEYSCGRLIFEGEYINGKRNGKGKEYSFGKLIFEGEYLYGYRIKGKYY